MCRPASGWLRVVLEKPFGRDTTSASSLAATLASSLAEEEIYRVDHYLGKAGVLQITEFMKVNKELIASLQLKKVDIALLETEDCAYVGYLL